MFPQSVVEQIGFYVYILRDPRNRSVFYVGKGVGNRVFQHVQCAVDTPDSSDKLDTIREILASGYEVEHLVVRHGMTEEVAFEVESALIDFAGFENLTNMQSGHGSSDFGIRTTDELISLYSAPALQTEVPIILININRLYRKTMNPAEIYDVTRKAWVLGEKRNKAAYVVPTYRGLSREVYKVDRWFPVGDRWGFDGSVADDDIRNQLRYKSISHLVKKGSANPVRYLNCD